MGLRFKITVSCALVAFFGLLSGSAFAQVAPQTAAVPLNFQQDESLTLTVNSGSPVTFDPTGAAGAPISVTLAWNIYGTSSEDAPIVYPYFSTSTALTTTGGGQGTYNIPTSAFTLAVSGSSTASATACTGTGSYTGGNASLYSNPNTATDNCPALFDGSSASYFNDSNQSGGTISTDSSATWSLTPALTGAAGFNAGTYTGTLNLYAAIE